MNLSKLEAELKAIIKVLMETIEQQSATIQPLSNEVTQWRKLLLKEKQNTQKIVL